MSVVFIVVPLALVVVLVAVVAYVWSARTGQFDDLDTPAMRMLHDDDGPGLVPLPAGEEPLNDAAVVATDPMRRRAAASRARRSRPWRL